MAKEDLLITKTLCYKAHAASFYHPSDANRMKWKRWQAGQTQTLTSHRWTVQSKLVYSRTGH